MQDVFHQHVLTSWLCGGYVIATRVVQTRRHIVMEDHRVDVRHHSVLELGDGQWLVEGIAYVFRGLMKDMDF